MESSLSCPCQICHLAFSTNVALENHVQRFESLERSLDEALAECRKHLPSDDCHESPTQYVCRMCQRSFKKKELLRLHIEDFRYRELLLSTMLTGCRLYHLPERNVPKQPLTVKIPLSETCDKIVLEGNLSRHFRQRMHPILIMATLADLPDVECYEFCPGCWEFFRFASAFIHHKCPHPSEAVDFWKHRLSKTVTKELKRVRQLTCVGTLQCVESFKEVEGEDTPSEAQRKRKASSELPQRTRHEQTSAEHAGILESQGYADPGTKNPTRTNTDSGEKSMSHKDIVCTDGQRSTNPTIPNYADGGFHSTSPNHASFYEGCTEGSYFADPPNENFYEGGLEGSYFADHFNAGEDRLEGSYFADL